MRNRSNSPAGSLLASCLRSGNSPVVTMSVIFSARSSPMPAMSVRSLVPARTRSAIGSGKSRTVRAALRYGQGVTTAAMSRVVTDQNGAPLADANVVAVHVPSGTQYRAVTRAGGTYNVPNMRVGGPYRVTATRIGYRSHTEADVFLSLGQDLRVDFRLEAQAVELAPVVATAERDEVLNPGRTGAATFIDPGKVELLPSIKRSTRDLIRTD